MMVAGAQIKGAKDGSITITSQGWSLLFCEREVQIGKENMGRRQSGALYLITKDKMAHHPPARVLSISQTGAITITVDPKGRVTMKGFLTRNLPL
jgi:hypothetical protein